jgi:hypothetical protein
MFNGVPVMDLDTNKPYLEQQLISEISHNPICSNLHFLLQPRWLCPTPSLTTHYSSFSFAFLDPDGSITQTMAQSHLAMFGKAVTLKKWQDRPPIIQCPRCHRLGHHGPHCQLPKDALCCHLCGGNHHAAEHPQKCAKATNHNMEGKCDCPTSCIVCKKSGHTARDLSCPAQDAYKTPAYNATTTATFTSHPV